MLGTATVETMPAPSAGVVAVAFKAPLLARILDPERKTRREVVLDLGAASQPMIDQLSLTFPGRIEVADLHGCGAITLLNAQEDRPGQADTSLVESALPQPNDELLDLVLCWDLPNYLTVPALCRLFDVVARRAAPGCRVHMLITYSRREMFPQPARYFPGADGQLKQVGSGDRFVAAPRYSPEELNRAVGNFRYQRGVLLANGMQEFVYAWPGSQA